MKALLTSLLSTILLLRGQVSESLCSSSFRALVPWVRIITRVGKRAGLLAGNKFKVTIHFPRSLHSLPFRRSGQIILWVVINQTFTATSRRLGTGGDRWTVTLQGNVIGITGTVELYQGKPEIKVMSRSQIKGEDSQPVAQ